MPLFEYVCRGCSRRFELLVRGDTEPACPACGGRDLGRALSVFAVGAAGRREPAAAPAGACGSCGDPRGPGACAME
jgi:putative FmdB family regulatory protein